MTNDRSAENGIRRGMTMSHDPAKAVRELRDAIHTPDAAIGFFFCSTEFDIEALGRELPDAFGDMMLVGCTTAGELTPGGYMDGTIVGVSLPKADFVATPLLMEDLSEHNMRDLMAEAQGARLHHADASAHANCPNTFAFLMIDGLSRVEEAVVSSLYSALGSIPMFGGSAGDDLRFEQTFVYYDGRFHKDAAVLVLVGTHHPIKVFKTQHFVSSDTKMVVTEADPSRRIVTEINAEPAGREYARLVGLRNVEHLTPMIFATYPVVVKVGGTHFVRSIQKVNEDESLSFFCAIDEGIVLTVAKGVDLIDNLNEVFEEIEDEMGPPQLVLGCDCVFRKLELERKQLKQVAGKVMERNGVVGFNTYGEQFNAMHVNQTFTGVAIGESTSRATPRATKADP